MVLEKVNVPFRYSKFSGYRINQSFFSFLAPRSEIESEKIEISS